MKWVLFFSDRSIDFDFFFFAFVKHFSSRESCSLSFDGSSFVSTSMANVACRLWYSKWNFAEMNDATLMTLSRPLNQILITTKEKTKKAQNIKFDFFSWIKLFIAFCCVRKKRFKVFTLKFGQTKIVLWKASLDFFFLRFTTFRISLDAVALFG